MIVKDMLLIGKAPGEADISVLLSGAQIAVKGTSVLISPRLSPSLTLSFGSAAEAERWAARLRDASQQAERAQAQNLKSLSDDSQRAQNARIAELEARVSATLHAAVDRSKRIKELEATIEEGRERDLRIKELEEAVQESMQEASVRGERIRELEEVLASRGGVPDAAASAVLEDAMRFAEQMLENRQEELAIDGEGAQGLQEAVEAVQRAKPAVDGEVAELVSQLVAALRWPLVLRRRLLNAEQTVKQQKELQDSTLRELHDLQQRHTDSEREKRRVEAEVASLSRQLEIAEKTAEEAVGRLEEIHNATEGEYPKLQDQQQLEEAKRVQAEALSSELRDRLAAAEAAAEAAAAKEKAVLDAEHRKELDALHQRHADTEIQKQMAETQATELRQMLVVAERNADEAVARQKEVLEKAHAEDLRTFQQLCAAADAQRDDAEERATELRKQLLTAEQAIDAAATRQKELVDQEYQEELNNLQQHHTMAQSQRDHAELQASELKDRLDAAEQATRQATEQATRQCAVVDAKRERAELQAIALKQRLVDAEQAYDKSMRSHKALSDTAHGQEIDELQKRHVLAQSQRDLAEERAAKLSSELVAAQQALDEHAARQREALVASREDDFRAVQLQYAKAEMVISEQEQRARELREKLANAEVASHDKASRQRSFLDAERTKALAEPDAAEGMLKAKMAELERRLANSLPPPASGRAPESSAPRHNLDEAIRDLDQRILNAQRNAERNVEAAAPVSKASTPVQPQAPSRAPVMVPGPAMVGQRVAPQGNLSRAASAKGPSERAAPVSQPQVVLGGSRAPRFGKAAPQGSPR